MNLSIKPNLHINRGVNSLTPSPCLFTSRDRDVTSGGIPGPLLLRHVPAKYKRFCKVITYNNY